MGLPSEEIARRSALLADLAKRHNLGLVEVVYLPDTDVWEILTTSGQRITGPTYELLQNALIARAKVMDMLGVPNWLRG